MFKRYRELWRELRAGRPGHRFQAHFNGRHRRTGVRYNLSKIRHITVGVALLVLGLLLLFVPGPGSLILIMGLALLGGEFLFLARKLDWSELRLRKWLREVFSRKSRR